MSVTEMDDPFEEALEQFQERCSELAALVRERAALRRRQGDPNADVLGQKVEAECRAKVEELNALQVSVR